jgi:hypothetical protein
MMVTGVSVEITDANGGVIESGPAGEKPAGSGHWALRAGTSVRFAMTATDKPGHTGVKTASK